MSGIQQQRNAGSSPLHIIRFLGVIAFLAAWVHLLHQTDMICGKQSNLLPVTWRLGTGSQSRGECRLEKQGPVMQC